MEIESSERQARLLAKRKQDNELEDQKLQLELARAKRDREKATAAEREKTDQKMVEISSAATQQMEAVKKLNSDRVRALTDGSQKHYENVAANTAEEIKRNDALALKAIEDRKAASMSKIKYVEDRAQDPFYQMRSLSPSLSEDAASYTVKLNLPEHEAKNLFVSGEGQYLKIALARRFQDDVKDKETHRTTKTNSYQSVTEQIPIPGAFDGRKISREFKDGVLTISVPKIAFDPKTGEGDGKIKA